MDEIMARLKAVEDWQSGHVDDFHGKLAAGEAEVMVDEHRTLMANTALLVSIVAGDETVDPFTGETGGREGGMDERLAVIEERTNGGVTVTQRISPEWTSYQKVTAVVGVAMAFVAMLPGVWLAVQFVVRLVDSTP